MPRKGRARGLLYGRSSSLADGRLSALGHAATLRHGHVVFEGDSPCWSVVKAGFEESRARPWRYGDVKRGEEVGRASM